MTERDRLAADLHEARIGCPDSDWPDDAAADHLPDADRLIALGWTNLQTPEGQERLEWAWWSCVNEPEDGPWEDASEDDRENVRKWAAAIAKAYREATDAG